MSIELIVPDIGDFSDVEVVDVLVNEGDTIAVEDLLISIETDKATMELPATHAGTISKLKVKVGDKVSAGSVIGLIEGDAAASDAPAKEATAEAAPAVAAVDSTTVDLIVPDLGDSADVPIIEILVAEGDDVEDDQPIISLESDKASMDIPAPSAGKITKITVNVGDHLSSGDKFGEMFAAAGAAPEAAPAPKADSTKTEAPKTAPAPASKPTNTVDHDAFINAHASPSVRKLARELDINLANLGGTGRDGRITADDLNGFIKNAMAGGGGSGLNVMQLPEIDFSKFGETEVEALTKINRLTGDNLHASWVNIPHVTIFDDADVTDLEDFRKQVNLELKDKGEKITPLAYVVKAVVAALKEFPRFNSSLDGSKQNLILKKYYNIGVAMDTPTGLVVPVIKDADKKNVREIAAEIIELAGKARNKKLTGKDMQGGCFTISSLGGVGGKAFTPIVNPPEVGILGLNKSSIQPVWNGKEFEPRLMMPTSLSFDHRVIDGVMGAKFVSFIGKVLSDTRHLL